MHFLTFNKGKILFKKPATRYPLIPFGKRPKKIKRSWKERPHVVSPSAWMSGALSEAWGAAEAARATAERDRHIGLSRAGGGGTVASDEGIES
jgi:hypothetical protein